MSIIHVLKQVQVLPIDLRTAWDLFSRPENLNDITPPDLRFKVLTVLPERVYPGLMISYQLKILNRIPFEWLTEITHVNEPYLFVDEQRSGPYSIWHHEHHFKQVADGVEMTDIVHYKLPLGRLGNLFHGILVKPQLTRIFDYRRAALQRIFEGKVV